MDTISSLRGELHESWGWLLALGIVLILFDLPTSAGWTLGTIVGVALVLQGVSLMLLSLDVRRAGAVAS